MSLPASIKDDFPVLQQQAHGTRLVYLDSANTSQKPQPVIDAMSAFYETTNANVHRGSYELAVKATEALEKSRETVARFINESSGTSPLAVTAVVQPMRGQTRAGRPRTIQNASAALVSLIREKEGDDGLVNFYDLPSSLAKDESAAPILPMRGSSSCQ